MGKIKKVSNVQKRLMALLLSVFIVTALLALPTQEVRAEAGTIETTARIENIQKYGNLMLDLKCEEILSAGYEYGDVLSVSFLDQNLKLPFCSNYSDVDPGSAAVFTIVGIENVQLAINMKDFATTYGIATKINADDNSISWQVAEGVTDPIEIKISMDTKGGYYGQYVLHQMSYTANREDYPDLTDEQFANFREVTTTGMGKGILYRSASPVDPLYNRNTYADAAIEKAHVTTIMNLSDDQESLVAFPGFDSTYYSKQNYIALNMGVDFEAEEFEQKLAEGIRYIISKPGVYLVHCLEGKDRAGFVAAIFECLMGASYDEVAADYMTSFFNYYGITPDDERYNNILTSNLEKNLQKAFGVKDLGSTDLSAKAAEYLKGIGISDEEITSLKKALAGEEAAHAANENGEATEDAAKEDAEVKEDAAAEKPETAGDDAAKDDAATEKSETAGDDAAKEDATTEKSLESATETAQDSEAPANIYVVKPGDNLSKIAKELYGDSKKWVDIYELNKDTITNPDIIYIGQELKRAE